jgi:hypothetical protein
MHKNAVKCNKTQRKWCINKHGASKIIDTFETYQMHERQTLKNKLILRTKPFPLNPLNFSPLTTNTKMDEEI